MNQHLARRANLDASPFLTGENYNSFISAHIITLDLGGRFRVMANNMESFLLYRKEVTDCADVGLSDQAVTLKKLLKERQPKGEESFDRAPPDLRRCRRYRENQAEQKAC